MKLEFSRQSFEKYTNFRPMGAEFLHADRQTDGRTDMAKLIVAVRNFAQSPKNQHTHTHTHLFVSHVQKRCCLPTQTYGTRSATSYISWV